MKASLAIFSMFLLFATTSCKKCKDCTTYFGGYALSTQEYCEEDLEALDKPENYNSALQSGVKCE